MRLIVFICFLVLSNPYFGQDGQVWMHPNKGQWHANIEYKVPLVNGDMYLEKNGFTYAFHNAGEIHAQHENEAHHTHADPKLKGHAVKTTFLNANPHVKIQESGLSQNYRNYFLGNNPQKWKSSIYDVKQVLYKNVYPSIDMLVEGSEHLKYSFFIPAGENPSVIQLKTEGASSMFIDRLGNLHTLHPFGEITESAPIAWNINLEGKKTPVAVRFKLKNQTVSFSFPEGYDAGQSLVIDPTLTFSTFTGSTADNWGFTAAPDALFNVFAAGVVFGNGYPISAGAFDPSFNGGQFDIGLTKYTANGTALLYSTYIGGSQTETPHSLICSPANELYVMGVTSSTDFPMAGSPYQAVHNGGPSFTENGLNFQSADLYVLKLNAAGTSLLASTFIGGSGTDGINRGALYFNYGDQFRGDIALDQTGNVYVASTSASSDFPIINGFQSTLNGIQDAVVFKLNNNLNSLLWSSYFGGSGIETGNSLQIAPNGNVYMAGGSSSPTLGFASGVTLSNLGGISDGYVVRINGTTPAILSGTFMGTNEYDQAYFVQLDLDDKVYVYGQTEGLMPITPGLFGTANSGQFIRKFNTNLTSIEWTTTIGAGTGHVEISPTAFLVSDCYDIYISGWGGSVNRNNSSAVNSTSSGFPVTSDAHQFSTNGNNFYIAVLRPNASAIKYATYMGGTSSSFNHVDGGTSRFDKAGNIYHSVCAACGGAANGFTTTPGVWSTQNASSNCNMAAFKFELNKIDAIVSIPTASVCLPAPVVFSNNIANGNNFFWDFGDGSTSTAVNPSHVYPGAGIYNVQLIVTDINGCYYPDTTNFTVTIGEFQGEVTVPTTPICPGTPFQLNASGGIQYAWSPAQFLDNPNIANPIATVSVDTDFQVIITDSCGTDTLNITLTVYGGSATVSNDTLICKGQSVTLSASGGGTYQWTPAAFLDNPSSANPIATPTQTTTFDVNVITPEGCLLSNAILVEVIQDLPTPVMPNTLRICENESVTIQVSGATDYFWSPPINIAPLTGSTVVVNPTNSTTYFCDFVNACGTVRDSIFIEIVKPIITVKNDTTICKGQTAILTASGGVSYMWTPVSGILQNTGSQITVSPSQTTNYQVVGTDNYGCKDSASVTVSLYPSTPVFTWPDIYAFDGDTVVLGVTQTLPGTFTWSPTEFLSCIVCANPIATPTQNIVYTVTYTDENGCKTTDPISIYFEPVIYVPNTFTPDGNLFNDVFKAVGGNVSSFTLSVYNRWGELIITLNSVSESWDGTYKGLPCQDGTYVWKMRYSRYENEDIRVLTGHVNLIR
ncbi:MAG: PKD domain-containing protein [Crocinitomicaceae bacterium]|nr:PKD domain-containing protein [Crocinitomicaceae bacterium]